MLEECREMGKLAKATLKDNPTEAVQYYKETADCYGSNDRPKERIAYLEKTARVLWDIAKSIEDPTLAEEKFKQSYELFIEIEIIGEAEKVLEDSDKAFVNSAKILRSMANKEEDLEIAITKFKSASEHAIIGKDKDLSKQCWNDAGDFVRKSARIIDNPREALDKYKRAIHYYRIAEEQTSEVNTFGEAAEKFVKRATNIAKSQKGLLFAIDNYAQAYSIYKFIKNTEAAAICQEKIIAICELVGVSVEIFYELLKNQGFLSISLEIKPEESGMGKSTVQGYQATNKKHMEDSVSQMTGVETAARPITTEPVHSPKPEREEKMEKLIQDTSLSEPVAFVKDEMKISASKSIQPDQQNEVQIREKFHDISSEVSRKTIPQAEYTQSKPVITDVNRGKDVIVNRDARTIPSQISEIDPAKYFHPESRQEDTRTDERTITGKAKPKKSDDEPIIPEAIVDLLRKQGYIRGNITKEEELIKIPEYQILWIIIQKRPISLEEIEQITELDSVSLPISNLQADRLIEQTNDYKWTFSKIVANLID